MSKIICKCGNILPDITDCLPYKGYIISDKELFKMYDFVDELIETENNRKESLMMTFRKNVSIGKKYIQLKEMYQCPQCGRILIENIPGQYSFFIQRRTQREIFWIMMANRKQNIYFEELSGEYGNIFLKRE